MFAVFGVCKAHFKNEAARYLERTGTYSEASILQLAAHKFKKSKSLKQISIIYSSPREAEQFRELMYKAGEARDCIIRQKYDTGQIHPKTKKPIIKWKDANG